MLQSFGAITLPADANLIPTDSAQQAVDILFALAPAAIGVVISLFALAAVIGWVMGLVRKGFNRLKTAR